jgi:hypothetical protein
MVKDLPANANHPVAVELRARIYRASFRLIGGDDEPGPAGQLARPILAVVPDNPSGR